MVPYAFRFQVSSVAQGPALWPSCVAQGSDYAATRRTSFGLLPAAVIRVGFAIEVGIVVPSFPLTDRTRRPGGN